MTWAERLIAERYVAELKKQGFIVPRFTMALALAGAALAQNHSSTARLKIEIRVVPVVSTPAPKVQQNGPVTIPAPVSTESTTEQHAIPGGVLIRTTVVPK